MSKKTKRTIVIAAASVLLIAAAVIIFLVVKANSAGYRSISIAEIFGKVIAQNDGKTYEAYKNMRLADGYELTTDPDSYTRMLLDDDKYVKLEQDSHAIFEALGDAKRHVTTIRLDKGALTSEITKPLTESESYVVNTPNAVLAVRGTMFRVEVKQEANGDYYSDVYTFGGTVVSRRIMPDGTLVDEEIEIPSGYKATVKMDDVITVYLEEKIEEEEDNIDPIDIDKVNDATLVDVYNASRHGHDVFSEAQELWNEIQKRDIDLSQYKSIYDGNEIPAIDENSSEASSPESDLNNSSESPDFSDNSVSGSSDSSSSSSTVSSSESGVSREPRPVSSSASSSETHELVVEPIIDPDTSASDEPSESSGEASDSRPASSSSRPASTSSEQPETPMVEHTHTLITTTSEPTCTKSGSKTVKCKVCGETISKETLPPKGHTSVTETVKPATCTDEGEEIDRCSVCGGQLGKRTLPALGHTERSTENDGVRTVTCSVCGQILRQINIASGVEYPVAFDATNFPDEAFRQYVSENFDTDGDGVLSLRECEAVETVNVKGTSSKDGGITSLDGIESFGKLKTLNCNYNSGLTELDVSKSAELNYLDCSNTSITLLDVSQNTALETLTCYNTSLTSLDVSENTALIRLLCQNTKITALDVSNNTALEALWCNYTQIASLDVSNNPEIYSFSADGNRHSIHVEDGVFDFKSIDGFDISRIVYGTLTGATMDANGVLSGITKGTNITYTYDCKGTGEMDFQGTFTLVQDESSTFAPETPSITDPVPIDEEHFPDPKFREYVVKFDTDTSGKLLQEECDAVTSINVSGTYSTDGGYTSLKGVEYFSKLETLDCSSNQELTELDVSKNTSLKELHCFNTKIAALDLGKNAALTTLNCYDTKLKSLDVGSNARLTKLYCRHSDISEIDVSKNIALTYLNCSDTQVASLNISKNTALKELYCFKTQIAELDVSKNASLEILEFYNTQITSLDVSKNTALKELHCYNTPLAALDVSKIAGLSLLRCENTQLPFVDISNNPNIITFRADGCEHPIRVENGVFDLNSIDGFDINRIVGAVEGMDENGVVSGITEGTNITYTYDCGQGKSATFTLVLDESSAFAPETPEITYPVAIDEEHFPDPKFREYVAKFDTDTNGKLSQEECDAVTSINVSGTLSADGGITSLDGIENFSKLKTLYCYYNSGLTSLDVSNNTALTRLKCYNTQITSLDVSNNTALELLDCTNTQITSLDVSKNTALTWLYCDNTQITSLDVSKNTALEELRCYRTQITSLDVSKNTALTELLCHNTQIPFVDISNCTNISTFNASGSKHPIRVENGAFDLKSIVGFDISRVSDLTGATMDENGILSGIIEGTNITYTYDCKGTGESTYMVTFTLVPTAEASTASISDEDDDDTTPAALPPDGDDTPPPNAPEETGGAPNEDAALPPENIDGLRFLPLGILALMRDRKRNTAFRVKRKAEI